MFDTCLHCLCIPVNMIWLQVRGRMDSAPFSKAAGSWPKGSSQTNIWRLCSVSREQCDRREQHAYGRGLVHSSYNLRREPPRTKADRLFFKQMDQTGSAAWPSESGHFNTELCRRGNGGVNTILDDWPKNNSMFWSLKTLQAQPSGVIA